VEQVMGHQAVWKVLEEIIVEFRKKDLTIPQTIMNDLKSAKVMIRIMDADESRGEIASKVEQYLGSVEAYLVTEAQKKFESTRIDEWLRRLEEAACEICGMEGKEKEEARFISGVPRDQKWIRVEPLPSLPLEKLKQLAKETTLFSSTQKDGHLLVYGKAEDIKAFVKKMTQQTPKE
jgi:hypothetical protein